MKPGGAFAAAAAAVIAATVLFAPGASGQDPGIPPLVEPSPEGSSESVVVENPLEPGLFEDPPAVAPDSGGQTVLVRGPQANSGAISVALCPAGTHVISGGYHVVANRQSNSGENYDLVDISAPMPAENGYPAGTGWIASLVGGHTVAFAVCMPSGQGIGPTTVAVSGASGEGGFAVVQCPTNKKVIGGGFRVRSFYQNGYREVTDLVKTDAPADQGRNGWHAQMWKGTIQALALCA